MVFWFSGTGNSLWLAQKLAQAVGDRLFSMADACVQGNFSFHLQSDERIGFVFPVYGWDVPVIVRRFIENLVLDSNNHFCYVACTYGDDMGKTEERVCSLLSRKGLSLQGIYAVQMPNTYVCLPGFDVDKVSLEKAKLRKAEDLIPLFSEWVRKKSVGNRRTFPGNMPWIKTYVLGTFFRRFLMKGKYFHSSENCIGCGKCAKVCPMHNIRMVSSVPFWGKQCAMCLACYHHCPRHAVEYGNMTRGKGQYLMKES